MLTQANFASINQQRQVWRFFPRLSAINSGAVSGIRGFSTFPEFSNNAEEEREASACEPIVITKLAKPSQEMIAGYHQLKKIRNELAKPGDDTILRSFAYVMQNFFKAAFQSEGQNSDFSYYVTQSRLNRESSSKRNRRDPDGEKYKFVKNSKEGAFNYFHTVVDKTEFMQRIADIFLDDVVGDSAKPNHAHYRLVVDKVKRLMKEFSNGDSSIESKYHNAMFEMLNNDAFEELLCETMANMARKGPSNFQPQIERMSNLFDYYVVFLNTNPKNQASVKALVEDGSISFPKVNKLPIL